jgi:hypothetical protein
VRCAYEMSENLSDANASAFANGVIDADDDHHSDLDFGSYSYSYSAFDFDSEFVFEFGVGCASESEWSRVSRASGGDRADPAAACSVRCTHDPQHALLSERTSPSWSYADTARSKRGQHM